MRIVVLDSFLLRFDDTARDAQLWRAEEAGRARPADLHAIAVACDVLDVVERPRLVKRDGVLGLAWTVWARRWGQQAPLERSWFDPALTEGARDLVEEVLHTNQPAAYEASLALELAGVLTRPTPHPPQRSRKARHKPRRRRA